MSKLTTLNTVNPSERGVFEEYKAKERATVPLGSNMTTYAKTHNLPDNTLITVYRGVPSNVNKINPGDFVTDLHQLAKDYAGGGKVLSAKVRACDILDQIDEPCGSEYIYRPMATKSKNKSEEKTMKINFNFKTKEVLTEALKQNLTMLAAIYAPKKPVTIREVNVYLHTQNRAVIKCFLFAGDLDELSVRLECVDGQCLITDIDPLGKPEEWTLDELKTVEDLNIKLAKVENAKNIRLHEDINKKIADASSRREYVARLRELGERKQAIQGIKPPAIKPTPLGTKEAELDTMDRAFGLTKPQEVLSAPAPDARQVKTKQIIDFFFKLRGQTMILVMSKDRQRAKFMRGTLYRRRSDGAVMCKLGKDDYSKYISYLYGTPPGRVHGFRIENTHKGEYTDPKQMERYACDMLRLLNSNYSRMFDLSNIFVSNQAGQVYDDGRLKDLNLPIR